MAAPSSATTKSTTKKAAKTPLRILCFGDSLTDGYPPSHPYALTLKKKLEEALPALDVQCDVNGVPGDRVTREAWQQRMRRSCERAEKPYDWVIVLGGTNDIGWGHPPSTILQALKKSWDVALAKGSRVLALTILDCKAKFGDIDDRRNALNDSIKAYKTSKFHVLDLYEAVPYRDMAWLDREKYWDEDGLHLTEDGYDLMGEKIAEGMIRILHLLEAQTTEISEIVTDARQRRMIEELIFEEERGNPKLLSQGYIIVRKRDLD